MTNEKKKVFVAMSGGVDSSVAAALLERQGYDAVGVHMRCYNVDGCAFEDAEDARRAAEVLNIPFYVFDFEREYKDRVVNYMVQGYKDGITPNPDVMCNKEIKFGLFLDKALTMGADYIATGHYVRLRRAATSDKGQVTGKETISHVPCRMSLFSAKDKNKDQSYFLWTLTQKQLKHCLFPLGSYTKPEVRKLAKKFGLHNYDKKDSQGICFLGKVSLQDFLKDYIPEKRGSVLSTAGEILGEHSGSHYYTIGQRHIGVANRGSTQTGRRLTQKKDFQPLYIAGKNMKTNTIVVVEGENNPALYKNEVLLEDINFINQQPTANDQQQIYTRIRYRQDLIKAKLICRKSSVVSCKLVFDQPVKFAAPGQSAVFYEYKRRFSASLGLKMLGGGIIK